MWLYDWIRIGDITITSLYDEDRFRSNFTTARTRTANAHFRISKSYFSLRYLGLAWRNLVKIIRVLTLTSTWKAMFMSPVLPPSCSFSLVVFWISAISRQRSVCSMASLFLAFLFLRGPLVRRTSFFFLNLLGSTVGPNSSTQRPLHHIEQTSFPRKRTFGLWIYGKDSESREWQRLSLVLSTTYTLVNVPVSWIRPDRIDITEYATTSPSFPSFLTMRYACIGLVAISLRSFCH